MGCGKSKPQPSDGDALHDGHSGSSKGSGGETELSAAGAAVAPARNFQQSTDGIVAAALRQKRKAGVVIFGESAVDVADLPSARRNVAKPDAVRELILTALRENVFFTEFGAAELSDLVNAMEERRVAAGTTVIVQGDPGDFFYVIERGTVRARGWATRRLRLSARSAHAAGQWQWAVP